MVGRSDYNETLRPSLGVRHCRFVHGSIPDQALVADSVVAWHGRRRAGVERRVVERLFG